MHLTATPTPPRATRLRDATGRSAGIVRLEAAVEAARASLPAAPAPRPIASELGRFVAPTREQDAVFDALALEHDLVIAEHAPTAAHPQRYAASCVTPGRAVVVYHVYPSGLRCDA